MGNRRESSNLSICAKKRTSTFVLVLFLYKEIRKGQCEAKKKPGVTVIAEKMSKSQKAEADLIGEYAKSIGREVIIVDDTAELGYGEANGMYKNGKIVLALNNTGGVMSVYFGHELFHDLKQTAPAQANELQAYVLDR